MAKTPKKVKASTEAVKLHTALVESHKKLIVQFKTIHDQIAVAVKKAKGDPAAFGHAQSFVNDLEMKLAEIAAWIKRSHL